MDLTWQLVVELVKTIYQLPGLRRVPGPPGQIGEVDVLKYGIEHDEYINHIGLPGHWPSSMQLAVSFFVCGDAGLPYSRDGRVFSTARKQLG